MRITALRATPVAVPYRTDEVWAFGRRSGLVSVIVEVDTDEGLTGLGEAAAYPSADVVLGVLRSLEPLVIGSDPLRIEQLIQRIDVVGTWHHIGSSSPAIAAVETACWDLLGKSCGRPIVDFFGGRFRDEVEFFHYVAASDPSDVRAEARRAAKSGARLCYLKVGADSLETDIERVAALRDGAGPEMGIRVDANEAWSPGAAVQAVRALEEYGLEMVEQPVSGRNLPEMAYVRSRLNTPLLANEASWTRTDQLAVIHHRAADALSVDNQMDGGLLNLKRSAGICAAAGLPVVKHSLGELGIALAAAVHVIAATPNFRHPNQAYGALLTDDILRTPFAGPLENYTNGRLPVPTAPGLGVELDPEKTARYADLYRTSAADFTFHDPSALTTAPALPKR
ncbi:mandelate racemase/muconate lactonizing enzyme family protein [Actinomadura madurae]|uniref:mandelate racemase/muconate lactonizing enzyme family protein n=1 Tax=Actinomadura madurae TaxID=1993 RepID=UPI0020D247D5|nr:mandelate racemase/muconate lactonizing enzyme family protein [Actinomadura madurae]MCP9983073.1 mandelate racemase/muconate lactonizing enzyme family protein [Actinomadura madurae]MCQ0005369.1 mandelate racemase/muconate lactonizing enzyme family protein [Actinomadura madurae]MCQ0019319.1 mandelate racemase/muconate lactonizing enzyme family protein [Actinomadura madurae]